MHPARRGGDDDTRIRANLLAAAVTATLLIVGTWLADELWEAGFACYAPDGGCEAAGVPPPQLPTYFSR